MREKCSRLALILAVAVLALAPATAASAVTNFLANGDFESFTGGFQQDDFSVANPSTHGNWLDLVQWSSVSGGPTGNYAKHGLAAPANGTTDQLSQGFLLSGTGIGTGTNLRLEFDYINEIADETLAGPEVVVYGFGPSGTWSRFAPWPTADATLITSASYPKVNSWTHVALPFTVPAAFTALAVGFRLGFNGFAATEYEQGVDNVALVFDKTLTALSPVHAWIGLKSSDDQGTQFDLYAELLKNDAVVATGLQPCIAGVTRNPSLATEAIVSWLSSAPVALTTGDVLSLRISTRIGTNGTTGAKCSGPGGSHNSAAGLRLYYDSTSRQSRFDWTITPGASTNEYLHSDGNPCANAESTGVTTRYFNATPPTAAAAKCKDSGGINFSGGNPLTVIGTWSMTLP
jgi:hypothetical protein